MPEPPPPPTPEEHAAALAKRFIILDGHVDVPHRLFQQKADGKTVANVSEKTDEGDFDYPRARAGGLDAPFMSIYVAARYEHNGAYKHAEELIDMVENLARTHSDKFALAKSPAEVRANFQAGKISLPMGMENGSPIEGKLSNVEHFQQRGIRYITLAHSKDNHISDSSYDDRHVNKGLSAFGKKVVAEMNRVGIMIDVSHISDDAFWQVVALSKVPVIASHSSCRHFTPDWPRNMSDEMIQALGKAGGVIQINFGSGFIDDEARKQSTKLWNVLGGQAKAKHLVHGTAAYSAFAEDFWKTHPIKRATVEQVADHVEHVVKLAGIDHVGIGSDFDGVGDTLPIGLEDASAYPNLIKVLIERGWSDADIEKLCSGNVLRVWQQTEDYAAAQRKPQ
ncbi:MAG: dipeptidase [Polyangiaceae bacterium]